MTNISVRIATANDCDDIFSLEEQYGEDVYSKDSIISTFNYDYYYTYLILEDNKVIGYISATIILDECNLLKIIVDKNYRKKGYAKILLNCLIDECKKKNIDKIFLEVRKDNDVAKMFYKSCGFKKESERLGYYNGVDAEIFWYYIND
jgi:ribosomal-protein-alanine N-acetyltransferase